MSGGVNKDERIKHFYSSNPSEITLLYYGIRNALHDVTYFLCKHLSMVVLDEAHKIKNIQGGVIASAVLNMAKYCKSRVVLTGTPAPNGYEDIYNLFKFIWPYKEIINYYPYQLKDMSSNPNDPRISALINNVSPYFIRIRKSDLKIPEPIENEPIIVRMGNLQEEIYNFIESKYMDYFLSGKDPSHLNDLLAKARLIRLCKLQQILHCYLNQLQNY